MFEALTWGFSVVVHGTQHWLSCSDLEALGQTWLQPEAGFLFGEVQQLSGVLGTKCVAAGSGPSCTLVEML